MRLFEIALLSAETLSTLLLILGRRGSWRLGFLVLAPFLVAIVQMGIEGLRWQMIPAYALVAVLLAAWFVRHRYGQAWRSRQGPLNGTAAVAVVMALAGSWLLPIALPVFRFPIPSGPYAIGTLTYHWTDHSRREVFDADSSTRRELMVQIWYPAEAGIRHGAAPYLEDAEALSIAQARLHGLPDFALSHLKYVTTNATVAASASDEGANFPVLIFLEGLTGYRQMNTFQVEALVSAGYIVVAIDQPFVAATVVVPDGHEAMGLSKAQIDPLIQQSLRPNETAPILNHAAFANGIIPYLAQDASFVLDQLNVLNSADPNNVLAGKLDMKRVGVFGVSIGAIVAGEACRRETRLQACLMMDAPMTAGVVRNGLRQPSMWITRDAETMHAEGWATTDIRQHQRTMWTAFERSPSPGYIVRVADLFHGNLTDISYFSPFASRIGITGPIDGRRAHAVVNAYSLAFFDRHLRGRHPPLLDEPTTGRWR